MTRGFFGAVVLALGFASGARASPEFPEVVASALGLPSEPSCALCHAGGEGRRGTVTTPFGAAVVERGTLGGDEGALREALESLRVEGTDSDGDGSPDTTELAAGADPNTPSGAASPPPIHYGCRAGSGGPAGPGALTALVPALAVALGRRRRARARP